MLWLLLSATASARLIPGNLVTASLRVYNLNPKWPTNQARYGQDIIFIFHKKYALARVMAQ